MIKNILDNIRFFKPKDNWHKLPYIRRLLCLLGRHDFELSQVITHSYVILECFYCLKKRASSVNTDQNTFS